MKNLNLCSMEKEIGDYFSDVKNPRVVGRCENLLADILVIAVCTYLSGGSDYHDMCLFGKERGNQLKGIILPEKKTIQGDVKTRLSQILIENLMRLPCHYIGFTNKQYFTIKYYTIGPE